MKNKITLLLLLLLPAFILSCEQKRSADEELLLEEIGETAYATMFYFKGNYTFTPDSATLQDFSTGEIIDLEMPGLPYIMSTEYAEKYPSHGKPVLVETRGYLKRTEDDKLRLDIKEFISFDSTHVEATNPLTGTYIGSDIQLELKADHTFTTTTKGGRKERGDWFHKSQNFLTLITDGNETIYRINYKKQSLNTLDDMPVILAFTSR